MGLHHTTKPEKRYPFWYKASLILIGLSLLVVVMIYGKFILMPLAFAGFFSMLLSPVVNWFEKMKLGRAGSIVITLFLLVVLLSGLISLISVQFVQFAEEIPVVTERLKGLAQDSRTFAEETLGFSQEEQFDFLQQGLDTVIERSGQYVSSFLGATTNVFTILTLLPIFMFFMLYYKEMYQTFLRKLFEKKQISSVDDMMVRVQEVTQNYLVGMLSVVAILAVLNVTGLLLIGLDHAIFFGVFAALIAVIPYIGTIIGGLLPTLYAFLFTDSLFTPLAVIGVFAVVQFLEGNIITPRIVGSKVSINPFMAMIALLIGAEIWGVAGMILFVPLIGILRVIFDQIDDLKPYGYLLGNKIEYNE